MAGNMLLTAGARFIRIFGLYAQPGVLLLGTVGTVLLVVVRGRLARLLPQLETVFAHQPLSQQGVMEVQAMHSGGAGAVGVGAVDQCLHHADWAPEEGRGGEEGEHIGHSSLDSHRRWWRVELHLLLKELPLGHLSPDILVPGRPLEQPVGLVGLQPLDVSGGQYQRLGRIQAAAPRTSASPPARRPPGFRGLSEGRGSGPVVLAHRAGKVSPGGQLRVDRRLGPVQDTL